MAKTKFFLQSLVVPANRFEIVKLDKARGIAVLKGKHDVIFEHGITQEELDKYQYRVEKEVEDD